jgi:hypothetical protein
LPKENLFHEHWILLVGAIIGIAYIIIAACKNKLARESYLEVVVVVLTASSTITGIVLMCKVLLDHQGLLKDTNLEESDLFYFLIGGGMISWNAAWETHRKFKELWA